MTHMTIFVAVFIREVEWKADWNEWISFFERRGFSDRLDSGINTDME